MLNVNASGVKGKGFCYHAINPLWSIWDYC